MKKIWLYVVSLFCFLGCHSLDDIQSIDSKTVYDMINNKEDFVLVDVREKDEYQSGHIPTSILIPLGTIEDDFETKIPDKNKKIVIYCRSGNRSKTAYEKIKRLGYTDIYDLGGIIDWTYETEK